MLGGWVEPTINFSKRGKGERGGGGGRGLAKSQFLEEVASKEVMTLFRGVAVFT